MHAVASGPLKDGFDEGHRVTINACATEVVFFATNGVLSAQTSLERGADPYLQTILPGMITVPSSDLKKLASAIDLMDEDHPVELRSDGEWLHVGDAATHKVSRKSEVRIPSEPEATVRLDAAAFRQGVRAVASYVADHHYEPTFYDALLLHLVGDEARFVSGDGSCFAIFSTPIPYRADDVRHVLPLNQAKVIASMLDDGTHITLAFPSSGHCHINVSANHLRMTLALPQQEYPPYDAYAYNRHWVAMVDVPKADLRTAMKQIMVAEGEQPTWAQDPVPLHLSATAAGIVLSIEDDANRCRVVIPTDYFDLGTSQFSAECDCNDFDKLATSRTGGDYVRIYQVADDSAGTLVADVVDLHPSRDDSPPDIATTHLRTFFLPLGDDPGQSDGDQDDSLHEHAPIAAISDHNPSNRQT
jgi:DNA polymerase III sliding clamp (beta) subunit (PCNA family)